jgi:hypothetical protein
MLPEYQWERRLFEMKSRLLSLKRWLVGIPQPRVSRDHAVAIAHAECERRGWGWEQPSASEELRQWVIQSQRGNVPSPWFIICQQSGEILRCGSPPL